MSGNELPKSNQPDTGQSGIDHILSEESPPIIRGSNDVIKQTKNTSKDPFKDDFSPLINLPKFKVCNPSTSFSGSISFRKRVSSRPFG